MVEKVSLVMYLPRRTTACLTVIIAWLVSFATAHAVILGDVQLSSRLGQPLEGTIDVYAAPGEQLFAECFHVKGTEVSVNMKFLGDIKSGKLLVTSKTRVREPLVNLRLTIDCPELPKTIRQFAVFLDPPKAEKPRLAELERIQPHLEPVQVKKEPLAEKPSTAQIKQPVVSVERPVSEKQIRAKAKQPLPQEIPAVEEFALKLSSQLSQSSQLRIKRSERLAIPKKAGGSNIATNTKEPDPAGPNDVIASKPNPNFDNKNGSPSILLIAALLASMIFVAWRFLVARTHTQVEPVTREAVDWLSNDETIKMEQAPSVPTTVDFEVQDLTAKMDFQDKGGHTIELDNESTRQLEESYQLSKMQTSEKKD